MSVFWRGPRCGQARLPRASRKRKPDLHAMHSGAFRYLGGRFPRENKNKVASGGAFRYLGGRFPRENKNKVAAGKWGG
ncbi:hypothetical protein NDU88_009221 [Pleurodeles waltl]|uniref:Uncharacterized protein n=1 Tax=Pleurodeles waltl TaxID=8319 RepID=A0AAV7QV53_PLEWA|nr:hypothetical protein NDU88_009221 [Pleurodeles waltl]